LLSFLEPANPNPNPRLIRLTHQQFQELSTDVYDELIRRNNNSATDHGLSFSPSIAFSNSPSTSVSFLPARDDFHPGRNRARQKFATLAENRFKDLFSDIHSELVRRHPEFKQEASPSKPVSGCDLYTSSSPRLSQDTAVAVRSELEDLSHCPSVMRGSDPTRATNASRGTATNNVVTPNKSATEEDIGVSSGRNDNHEKMSFGRASFASVSSAKGVGSKASTALSEKRGARDKMDKTHKHRANFANFSEKGAPWW
jgi:Spa2 homology domain (SHD) of GIT